MRSWRAFAAAVCSLLIVVAAACGGDKDSGVDGASGRPSSGASATSVDLSEATESLLALKSFRFDFSMKMDLEASTGDAFGDAFAGALFGLFDDIKAEGAFIAPDRFDGRLKFAGQEIAFVQIGDKAWVKEGSRWQATDASDGLSFGTGSPADLFSEFLPQDVLRGAKTKTETVNGVKTTRYSFNKKALESVAAELGETADFKDVSDANIDLWLMDGNVPVRILMSFAGKDASGKKMSMKLELNIRDINSSSISIKPPI